MINSDPTLFEAETNEMKEDSSIEKNPINRKKPANQKENHAAKEHCEIGSVKSTIWHYYGNALGLVLPSFLFLSLIIMQVSRNGIDGWLAYYTEKHHHGVLKRDFVDVLLLIAFINVNSVAFRSFLFASGVLSAARGIYNEFNRKVLKALLLLFQENSLGRILNRISRNTYDIDESLPFMLNIFFKDLFDALGALVIIVIGNSTVPLILLPVILCYFIFNGSIDRLHDMSSA